MKEYNIESGERVDINTMRFPPLDRESYKEAHMGLVIVCHDIIIEYMGGALLVIRDNYPVKGILWPIGGRIERGIPIEDSICKKVREECNLNLEDLTELGVVRTFFKTDPFGHGRGTDSVSFMYFGKGGGKLKLDNLHKNPEIILPEQYTSEFKAGLHPYVQDFMDLVIPLIKK